MSDLDTMTNAVTLGEVNRKVDAVLTSVQAVSDKVGELPTYRDFNALDKRISDVEAWQTWALRLVVGALILAVISAVFAFKP